MKNTRNVFTNFVFTTVIVCLSVSAAAATKSSTKAKKNAPAKAVSKTSTGAKLGTQFDFNEMNIHGRYQGAFESSVVVENEKQLTDLLDYRTEYKDRLQKSAQAESSAKNKSRKGNI